MLFLLMTLLSLFPQLPTQPAPNTNVVLITLDGVRWQEVFTGTDPVLSQHHMSARELLPNLYDLFVDHGIAIGQKSPIIASGPNHISLPGYLEITRGHPSTDCQRNDCYPIIDQSIFQLFDHPVLFSSWDVIARTAPSNIDVVINSGRDVRSESWKRLNLSDNTIFPHTIGAPDYRPDIYTEAPVIQYALKYQPDLLWIGLGDGDEYGHLNNYPEYLASMQQTDEFIGSLVRWTEQSDYGKNTVFLITADHGRNANFRDHGTSMVSARVFLLMHGKDIPAKGNIGITRQVSLSNIFPTIEDLAWEVKSSGSIMEYVQ